MTCCTFLTLSVHRTSAPTDHPAGLGCQFRKERAATESAGAVSGTAPGRLDHECSPVTAQECMAVLLAAQCGETATVVIFGRIMLLQRVISVTGPNMYLALQHRNEIFSRAPHISLSILHSNTCKCRAVFRKLHLFV